MSSQVKGAVRLTLALTLAALAVVAVSAPQAQQQSPDQRACILGVNKGMRSVAKARGTTMRGCVRDASRAGDASGVDTCVMGDADGRVGKARGKTTSAVASRCGTPPDFGYTDATTTNDAAEAQEIGMLGDVFGSDLPDTVISSGAYPDGARCQQMVQKSYEKVMQASIRAFEKCKKSGLSAGTIDSQADLAGCLGVITSGGDSKIAKSLIKLADVVASACAGVDMSAAFPGQCGPAAFTDCVQDKSICRACLMLDESDALGVNCDVADDGTANASCIDPRRCGDGVLDPGEGCDDGNEVSGDCCSATCTAEPSGQACTSDGNACTDDVCNGAGACAHPNNSDPCNDGLFCNGTDTCAGGSCSAHSGSPCTGGGECADACNETADNCFDAFGTACTDDGNECTNDRCNGTGACTHPALPSESACGDPSDTECTNPDTCNGAGACQVNHASSGAACGNPADTDCTNPDTCNGAGTCLDNHASSGAACGNPADTDCTDPDTCNASGACLANHASSGSACGNASDTDCTDPDTCDASGTCLSNHTSAGTACTDDGNDCTDDICDAGGGCTHPPFGSGTPCGSPADTDCSNPDTCNGAGTCQANHETAGSDCTDDGNDCTDDICDASGGCTHPPLGSGTPCGNPANTDCTDPDTCNGSGTCLANHTSSGTTCTNDGNECTNDICNGGGSCTHPNYSNGTPCTSDGNVCTDDYCNGAGSCTHPNNNAPCSDGLFCNGADTCVAGACTVHAGNPCPGADGDGNCSESCNETADNCTAADPNGSACTDGQTCNGSDSCSGGSCVGSGVCCGTVDFTFTVNSNSGGAFDSAEWPGGTQSQTSSTGCSATINNPNNNIDLVCTLGAPFSVNSWSGFQNCFGTGGEDGDGCQPLSCPFAGIGSCCSTRPSCSVATNGSGSARYLVRCVDP